jgi:hypothetical protein
MNSATDLSGQIDKLANFIMNEVPGEPRESEGAVDCAIRIIRECCLNERAKKSAKLPDVTIKLDGDMLVARLELLVERLEKAISDAMSEAE